MGLQAFGQAMLYPGGTVAELDSLAGLVCLALLLAGAAFARFDLGPLIRVWGRARKRSGARPSTGGDSVGD